MLSNYNNNNTSVWDYVIFWMKFIYKNENSRRYCLKYVN